MIPVLFEVFWKSGAALGGALLVNTVLRKKSADMRRVVLSTAILVMFAAALALPVLPRCTAVAPVWLQPGVSSASLALEPRPEPVDFSGRTEATLPVAGRATVQPPRIDPLTWLIPVVWFAGTTLLLMRFAVGLHGLRQLRIASEAMEEEHLFVRGRRVALLRNETIAAPATWGVLRPVILVPAGFERLLAEDRNAVLCHELAHVQGGDFLLRGMAEIARALIWFQPLMWMVRRQLRVEQELACDDRVLAAGGRPSAYARLLLEWDVQPGTGALAAVGMAHRSCLKRRLDALLAQGLQRDRVAGAAILATWLAGLAAALPLAALSFTQAVPAPASRSPQIVSGLADTVLFEPAPAAHRRPFVTAQMRQTRPAPVPAPQPASAALPVVSAPLAHFVANTSLVIVDTVARDQNGNVIEGLKASNFGLTEDGKSQAIAIFEYHKLDNATQGVSSYYVLGYYTPNGKPDGAYRNIGITLPGNTTARLDFRAGYYGANIMVPAFTIDGITDMHTATDVTPPAVLSKWDPEYSEPARRAKYSGTVVLVVDIDGSGQVTGARITKSLGMGLDEKATEAVLRWSFRPGSRNGQPVAMQAQVDVNFRLF